MAYIVIEPFYDLTDNNHSYRAGDTFPRPDFSVNEKRIAELAGSHNKRGLPLIVDADAECEDCRVEARKTPVEAVEDEPKEIPVQSVETPRKGRRSRQKEE